MGGSFGFSSHGPAFREVLANSQVRETLNISGCFCSNRNESCPSWNSRKLIIKQECSSAPRLKVIKLSDNKTRV
jgi:hypothetical protein